MLVSSASVNNLRDRRLKDERSREREDSGDDDGPRIDWRAVQPHQCIVLRTTLSLRGMISN